MLKAGKSIKINGNALRSEKAVLIAPAITIMGIQLRADTVIPKEVIDFFATKDAIIQQFSEDGDKLVQITGNFVLTKNDMQNLLKTKGLDVKILTEAKEINEAHNFQKQVNAKLFELTKPKTLTNNDEANIALEFGALTLVQTLTFDANGNATVTAEKKLISRIRLPNMISLLSNIITSEQGSVIAEGQYTSNENLEVTAGIGIELSGTLIDRTTAGFLTEIVSGKNSQCLSKKSIVIKDTVALSGKEVNLSSQEDEIQLSFNHKTAWFNAPTIPSLVFAYNNNNPAIPASAASAATTSTASVATSDSTTSNETTIATASKAKK